MLGVLDGAGAPPPALSGEQYDAISTEAASCPWNSAHQVLRVGLRSRTLDIRGMPPAHLTFLVDVSGSMNDPRKLPLLKSAFHLLIEQLRDSDRVAIAVYAGNAGLMLDSTSGREKTLLHDALDRLEAGGSTAGGDGIQLAYALARRNFQAGASGDSGDGRRLQRRRVRRAGTHPPN